MRNCVLSRLNTVTQSLQMMGNTCASSRRDREQQGRERKFPSWIFKDGRKEGKRLCRHERAEIRVCGTSKVFFYTAALQSTGSCLITKTIDKTGAKCLPLRFPPGR